MKYAMAWMANSMEVKELNVDIFFMLDEFLFVGDPNNIKQWEDEAYRVPLKLPAIACSEKTLVGTSEALNHTGELATYYKTLIKEAHSANKILDDNLSSYFWLELRILNTREDVMVSFPDYETLGGMQVFFDWLKSSPVEPFNESYQAWEIEAVPLGNQLFLRESDPDEKREICNILTPFDVLLKKVEAAETRARTIITDLSKIIGVDLWTEYPRGFDFRQLEWPKMEEA